MNIYIVFNKEEDGEAVATRYIDEEDKLILNALSIPTELYVEGDPRVYPPCELSYRLPNATRIEVARMFGRVTMDIDPATKLPRSV